MAIEFILEFDNIVFFIKEALLKKGVKYTIHRKTYDWRVRFKKNVSITIISLKVKTFPLASITNE